jgi:hypothetical protein
MFCSGLTNLDRDIKAVPKPSSAQQLLSLRRAPSTCVVSYGEPPILPKSSAPFIFVACLGAIGLLETRIGEFYG